MPPLCRIPWKTWIPPPPPTDMIGYLSIATGLMIAALQGFAQNLPDPLNGQHLFETKGCETCHSIGMSSDYGPGPDLTGITRFRKREWLHRFLKDPAKMQDDPIVRHLRRRFPMAMPNFGLSDKEVEDLIEYLAQPSEFPLER